MRHTFGQTTLSAIYIAFCCAYYFETSNNMSAMIDLKMYCSTNDDDTQHVDMGFAMLKMYCSTNEHDKQQSMCVCACVCVCVCVCF
jgi:ribonucleotide reductase beta subunit family protein with ferritin-like domain